MITSSFVLSISLSLFRQHAFYHSVAASIGDRDDCYIVGGSVCGDSVVTLGMKLIEDNTYNCRFLRTNTHLIAPIDDYIPHSSHRMGGCHRSQEDRRRGNLPVPTSGPTHR